MQSNYKVRKYLFFNRTSDWSCGYRIVLFFFDTLVKQSEDYLADFARMASEHPSNYYLFVTAEYNSLGMHALDAIPEMLNFNILNDDQTFFGFLRRRAIPCVQFYSELGRLECECHPACGQVRGYLGKRTNTFFYETDTYKRKITNVLSDENNIICQIRRSEVRDQAIKNRYEEFSLDDINDFYKPRRGKIAALTRKIPNYPFVDGVGKGFLRQRYTQTIGPPKTVDDGAPRLQGMSQTKNTYRFGFESDLNLKCDQIRRFRSDVVRLGRKQQDFIPKKLVLYKEDIMQSDTSHLQ